jgi:hypothetical protein
MPALDEKRRSDGNRRQPPFSPLKESAGGFPPEGMDYHVCFGADGNLRVSKIWDSREQLDAFGERLMPVLADIGIDPGAPEVLDVHIIVGC